MRHLTSCASFLLCLMPVGCGHRPSAAPETELPTVTVARPIERAVTDYVEFTGRTDAVFNTEIRPRVTGYLTGMPFKEGALVAKDEILFEIDDRPYKAMLDHARGEVQRQKGSLDMAEANLKIGLDLVKINPAAISKQDINSRTGARDEAAGALKIAEANLVTAQLNYDWCKVRSPIEGRVNRYNLTLGNLVKMDLTLLTTVVSEKTMYVYFDVDENTMLYVLRKILLPSQEDLLAKKGGVPVYMGLGDEKEFPHKGTVNFAENVVNASTGTISVRGVFDNPATTAGKRLLRPGMFVRVRLPLGKAHPALLVNEKALGTDQGQKYLLMVDDKNIVDYRRVTVGALQDDGLRVVEKGLNPGEAVIISGLQMVRPQMEVKTEPGSMTEERDGKKFDHGSHR